MSWNTTIKIIKINYSYYYMYQWCVCVCVQDPGPIAPLFMKQLLRVDCSLCALCWPRYDTHIKITPSFQFDFKLYAALHPTFHDSPIESKYYVSQKSPYRKIGNHTDTY